LLWEKRKRKNQNDGDGKAAVTPASLEKGITDQIRWSGRIVERLFISNEKTLLGKKTDEITECEI